MLKSLKLFPAGSQVRLSPKYIDSIGCKDEHGIGKVVGPVPDTPDWRAHRPGRESLVMVQWPPRKVGQRLFVCPPVPCHIDNLVMA